MSPLSSLKAGWTDWRHGEKAPGCNIHRVYAQAEEKPITHVQIKLWNTNFRADKLGTAVAYKAWEKSNWVGLI